MSDPTRDDLRQRIAELESMIEALKAEEVDAIVGERRVLLLRLRETELALRESQASLEHRVRERTGQLQRLAAELAATEQRERRRMAAMIHDDLQQLLVASRMRLAGAVATDDPAGLRAAGRAVIDLLDEAVAVSRDLTQELRPPVLYEVGLLAALQWLAGQMQKRHGLAVSVIGDPTVDPLDDATRVLLFESARELLFNVRKHARVSAAEVRLERLDAERIAMVVEDHGRGFDAERPFSGFGLFSIRERVTAIGGAVRIAALADGGTRVQVIAPRRLANEPSPTQTLSGEAVDPQHVDVSGSGVLRVLVVDDHPVVRAGIATIIDEDPGLAVVAEAGDGYEALGYVERLQPDVVLMDVNMPRLNGIDATREITRRWPAVVVIGISVQGDEATVGSLKAAGARAFLLKSDDPQAMRTEIYRTASRGS